jgi:hypothetical protein
MRGLAYSGIPLPGVFSAENSLPLRVGISARTVSGSVMLVKIGCIRSVARRPLLVRLRAKGRSGV